ncbi:MAG: hypothetical protein GY804_02640 [Alphaproteobacteria bacterium]|nr:hypothetical protein [Alphaproteobacteria bacterium]
MREQSSEEKFRYLYRLFTEKGMGVCSCYVRDLSIEHNELLGKTEDLERKLKIAVEVLREIRDNFDCDEDAHKYNTTCRSCFASEALDQIKGES